MPTSQALPRPLANGNVINDGTKNTGNHFANSIAPGFRVRYNLSPAADATLPSLPSPPIIAPSNEFSIIMKTKRAPHPARLDGNGIENLTNMDRNITSRTMSANVANAVLLASSAADVDDDVDVAEAAARRAERKADGCPRGPGRASSREEDDDDENDDDAA